MAYRPQFAYAPAPPGYRDEPYEYFFDGTNTPGLQFNLLTPQPILDIPLSTESDSEFHIRGLQIGTFEDLGPLGVQLKDAAGNLLSTDFVPMQFYTGFLLPAFQGGEAMPVESEIIVPPAGIPRISLMNLAAGPWSQLLPDSVMLPAISSGATLGIFKGQAGPVGGTAVNPVPFYYAGNLYMVVQETINAGNPAGVPLGVYQWDGNAQVWNQLDGAHAPVAGSGNQTTAGILFDGVHTITVAYNPSNVVSGLGALTLRDFDLATGLWVAAGNYPAGPNVYTVNQLFRRSDGTIVVIDGGVAGHTGLNARILTAGVWSTVALDTNLPLGQASNGGSAAVYDPATGGIHIFGLTNSGGGNNGFYQFFSLANALGTFVGFTPADFYINGWAMGNPVIVGNSIYFGVIDPGTTFASLLVGTPLAGPVFSAVTVNIDPKAPAATGGNRQPSLAYDATTGRMYATWTPDLPGLRISWATAPFTSWTGVELAPQYTFATTDGTIYTLLQYPVIGVSSIGVPYIAFETLPTFAGQPTEVILRILTQISLPVTLRGVKRFHAQACALPGVGK